MLFRAIASEPGSSDLEFLGSIAKGHKAQDPQKNTDSFGADIFDCADIDGLTIITKPVAKIDLTKLARNALNC